MVSTQVRTSGSFPGRARALGRVGKGWLVEKCLARGWRSLSPLLTLPPLVLLLVYPLPSKGSPAGYPWLHKARSAGARDQGWHLEAKCCSRPVPGGRGGHCQLRHKLQGPLYILRNHFVTHWPWQPDQTASLAALAGGPQKRTPALGRRQKWQGQP